MDLSKINLNLLVVLDLIIERRSISQAAKKLNLTQSAISHMLKHLRTIMDDDLILRGPFNKMILTKKAQDLKEPIKKILRGISDIFTETRYFDPQYDKFIYSIGMPDIVSILLLPELNKHILEFSDNVSIKIKNILDVSSYEDFTNDNLDFAIGNYSVSSQSISYEKLFSTELVCVGSKQHEVFAKKKLTLETFLKYRHLQVIYREDFHELYNQTIKKKSNQQREIVISIPDMMVALHSLKNSNYLCIAHKNIVEKFSQLLDLDYRQLPFKTPLMNYYLYWKREDENNTPIKWMKDIIIKSFKI